MATQSIPYTTAQRTALLQALGGADTSGVSSPAGMVNGYYKPSQSPVAQNSKMYALGTPTAGLAGLNDLQPQIVGEPASIVSPAPAAANTTYNPSNPASFVPNQAPVSAYDMAWQPSSQVSTGDSGSGTNYTNSPSLGNADLSSLFAAAGYAPTQTDTNQGGDSGGGNQDETGAAMQDWLAQNGYTLGTHYMDNGSYTNLFNAAGNRVGGNDVFTAPDTQDNLWGEVGLGLAGGFGVASAALAGGAAAGSALPATDAGLSDVTGAAGYTAPTTGAGLTQDIAYQPYTGAGSQGFQVAGDNAVAPEGALSPDASASPYALSSATSGGVTPAAGTWTSGLSGTPGLTTGSSGLFGTGITGTQALTGATSLAGAADALSSGAADTSQISGNGITPGTGTTGLQATGGPGTSLYNPSGTYGGIDSSSLGLTPPSTSSSSNWLSSLQNALTSQNASGTTNGLSGLGKSLVGLGASGIAGAITGTGLSGLGVGDTSQLNNINYQNAATAMGQSARTDQTNSQGSLTYNQTGTDAQGNPTYTQSSTLNAPYQSNLNQALGNQSTALGNLSSYNSNLPAAYAAAPSLYGDAGSQAALVKQAQDAAYNSQTSYLDPQYAQQQKQLQAQLANQGVSYGSDAYNAAMTQFGTQQNQAYGTARDSAIAQGDTYANTLFNQNLQANSQYNTNLNNQGTQYQNQSSGALNGVTQNPTFAATPAATNYLGAAQLQGNANLNQYNAKIGNTNALGGNINSLLTAGLTNQSVWNGIGNGVSGITNFFSGGGNT